MPRSPHERPVRPHTVDKRSEPAGVTETHVGAIDTRSICRY